MENEYAKMTEKESAYNLFCSKINNFFQNFPCKLFTGKMFVI